MRTYICLISDERFSVPSLVFQGASDEAAMREVALNELRTNRHCRSFEARLDDASVFTLARADADVAE